MLSVLRGKDPLPGRPHSPKMHTKLSREAKVLPRSLRNNAGPPSNRAAVHAGKLPGAAGVLDLYVLICFLFMVLFCGLDVFLL